MQVKRVYFFPLIITAIVILLTSLRISGTSVPVYSMLNGNMKEDPGHIANYPRGVRSDEWLVITQLTIAQSAEGFPRINQNIGDGQNMSFQDVPHKSWFTVFSPQNLAFFVLPLEYAFAFKWWFSGLVLVLAVYLMSLRFVPGNYVIASLLGLITLFSPMIIWWWQAATLLPVGYALLCGWLFTKLLEAHSTRDRLLFSILLFYIFLCFCFIIYPPFQIVSLIVSSVLVIGWFLDRYRNEVRQKMFMQIIPYLLALLILSVIVLSSFYVSNKSDINLIINTVYPGVRVEKGGGLDVLYLVGSFLSPILQSDVRAAVGYLSNQSAASTFIFLTPFLFLPTVFIFHRRLLTRRGLPWALLLTTVVIIFFLIKGYFKVELLQPVYKILLLDKVPNLRLLLGIGTAGIFHIVLLMNEMKEIGSREKYILGAVCGTLAWITMIAVSYFVSNNFPDFAPRLVYMAVLATIVSAIVLLVVLGNWRVSLILLLIFSAISTFKVHPLYAGLGALTESPVIQTISSYPNEGKWVVLGDRLLVNFPLMAGKGSISGVHYYPQLNLWHRIDPEGRYNDVYNRYAHVMFDNKQLEPFILVHTDLFTVRFDPCGSFERKEIQYILSADRLLDECLINEVIVSTPARSYYIYDVNTN